MSCPARGKEPNAQNYCMSYVGDQITINNFCTDIDDETTRQDFCESIGPEWSSGDIIGKGSCYYDDCQPGYTHEPGRSNCCDNPNGDTSWVIPL